MLTAKQAAELAEVREALLELERQGIVYRVDRAGMMWDLTSEPRYPAGGEFYKARARSQRALERAAKC